MRPIIASRIASGVAPVRDAVAASTWAMRSVATRPGARPLIRIGAISAVSDLISPASPGRMRLDVVRPGMGSRAEDDRMTRMAGRSLARRCGRAARMMRSGAEQGAIDGPRPGGLVEVLEAAGRRPAGVHEQEVQAAQRLDRGGDGRCRAVRRWPGRRPRPTAPASAPTAASRRSDGRATRATRAPSPVRVAAMAPPRPPEPPPTSARAPSRPRSMCASTLVPTGRWYATAGTTAGRWSAPTGLRGPSLASRARIRRS